MELSWTKTYDECLAYFNTDGEKGLTPDQVKKHQEKYGPNGEWHILITIFFTFIVSAFANVRSFESNFAPIFLGINRRESLTAL